MDVGFTGAEVECDECWDCDCREDVEDNEGLEKADVEVGIELEPAVELYRDDRGSEELVVAEARCDGGRYTLSGCWLPAIIMLSGLIPTCKGKARR